MINGLLNESMIDMKNSNTFLKVFVSIFFMGFISQSSVMAQCEPVWGTDSVQTLRELSTYREFVKQDNYKDALAPWRYVFFNAPGAKERTHVDGVAIYTDLIKKAKSEEIKEKYVDTLLMIYDKRMECFGVDGETVIRKAIVMISYRANDVEETYKTFKKGVEMAGDKTPYFAIYPYTVAAINAYKRGVIDDAELLNIYISNLEIIEKNQNGKQAKKYQEAQDQVEQAVGNAGILSCENLKPILEKQYEADPENQKLWQNIFNQMKALRCASDPLFIEVSKKLFDVEPSAEIARILAMNASNQGQYSDAIKYFKEAIEREEDNENKAEYSLMLAEIYQKLDDFPSARSYARDAASFKSNWGQPYMLIGDLYRGSGPKCGSGTGFESQVVTWPAIDMYEKAKNIDPSLTSIANKKIVDTQQYMPSKGECFMRSLNEGDAYKVECWIQANTTVRYGPEQ